MLAQCAVCGHAAPAHCRVGRCRLCQGPLRTAPAPPDLLSGWRCGCPGCALRVC